ncbi:MAG: polysaccharide deacetylase family protein [Clostridiales bacterium]|nr:polysaccharide deacetylase family protein [Clostridiales bacterium]
MLALTALLLAVFLFLLFQGLKQNADEHQAPAAQASASQTDAQEEPAAPPAAVQPTKLPILMYHHLVPDGEACNEMTITAGRMEQDLQWLRDNGYHTVLPRELAAGQALPEKPVLLTFDDGYRSNYELLFPLLQKYQMKAVISIIACMQELQADNFISWDMCREMNQSGLVEIGSHTYSLHNLGEREGRFVAGQPNGIQREAGETDAAFQTRVLDDIQKSYDLISKNVDKVTFFAYPYGVTEPGAEELINRLFPVTVITKPGTADLTQGLHGMPRYTITMDEPPGTFLGAA